MKHETEEQFTGIKTLRDHIVDCEDAVGLNITLAHVSEQSRNFVEAATFRARAEDYATEAENLESETAVYRRALVIAEKAGILYTTTTRSKLRKVVDGEDTIGTLVRHWVEKEQALKTIAGIDATIAYAKNIQEEDMLRGIPQVKITDSKARPYYVGAAQEPRP